MTTLTVTLTTFGPPPGDGWRSVVDLAVACEDAGVDRVLVTDHVVMSRNTDAYHWGRFPVPPESPWLEPLTVLTAMAAATSRLRLATGILIAPLRPAALLAKTVATLDQLSGGRVDLGVGTGWQREEYDAVGLDFADRGQLLTDTMAACRRLWEDTPASFSSPSFAFEDVFCEPKPAQARLPVWFAGTLNARNLARVVGLGDGWIPIMGASVDDIAKGVDRLRSGFADAGRDPATLQVQAPVVLARNEDRTFDLAGSMASVPTLEAAGATDVGVNLKAFWRDGEPVTDVLDRIVAAFRASASR